jgi:short-subunit dehydrogenase
MRHLVTGATSGIGRVVAERLRERGDHLVLPVRSAARAAEIGPEFPGAQLLVADLAEPGTLNGLAHQVDGPLDSVVHAAGVVTLGPVARARLQDWQDQLAVNLLAPVVLTREFLPALRSARGTVVFVNSGSGLHAHPQWSSYAASKHGLKALADSLRGEEPDIRVTSVFPGRTATPMQAEVHRQEGEEYEESEWIRAETVADAIIMAIDLPTDATVPDVTIRPNR